MTQAHKSLLKSYGRNTKCIAGTHGLNNYNFQLYTLLTLDEIREGFPRAIIFSNRGDENVLSTFFKDNKGCSWVYYTSRQDYYNQVYYTSLYNIIKSCVLYGTPFICC